VLALAVAAPSFASEKGNAERLYTRGLAEMHAGHDAAALALFQQAVTADPKDVHALYYRALGYGHAGQYKEAAADLKIVVAAGDPTIYRDTLELGYAEYRLNHFDDAAAALQSAVQRPRAAGEATLLLGIVEIRRGNYAVARANLAKVEALDASLALQARYYQGLAAYRAGDEGTAVAEFTWVSQQPGGGPFPHEASAFLDAMRQNGAKRYRLYAGVALEYDSNVQLAPDSDSLSHGVYGISNKDDGRTVFTAGGKYSLLSTPSWNVAIGYDFLQSLHFDLDSFDVQSHQASVETSWVRGPLTLGMAGAFDYDMLDEKSLDVGGYLLPWARWDEGAFGHTEVYYRLRHRNFVEQPYSPVRDSLNNATGIRQYFSLGMPTRNIVIGYRFDSDEADHGSATAALNGHQYDYHGDQFEGGVQWDFGHDWFADAVYAYKLENYAHASGFVSLTGDSRDDDRHTVIARVEKRLNEYLWLNASYIFRFNSSDENSFQYTRHITSLGLEARY
jgi:Tfp pilus assembly protein PilF